MVGDLFGDVDRVTWDKNLQHVLRSGHFDELYEKVGFQDSYLENLFGEEPEYDWRIDEEVRNGNLPRQIKEAIPYIIQFCEQENLELDEIIPSFEYDGWNPHMHYSFKEKMNSSKIYNLRGHLFGLEGLKGSIKNSE